MDRNTNLKLISYNCKHLGRDKYDFIKTLLNSSDFLFLQEHCMYEVDFFEKLHTIMDGMECIVSSEMDPNIPLTGRPKGGCAIIWSAKLCCKIEKLKFENDKICGIRIEMSHTSILLINSYMPCDTRVRDVNLFKYIEILEEISVMCSKLNADYIVFGGDLNTDLHRNSFQTQALKLFANNEKLILYGFCRGKYFLYVYE